MKSLDAARSVTVGLLVTASVVGQRVWTVTTFDGIPAAISAASPGDVLLLPNTGGFPDYDGFSLTKGLTIRGNNCRIGATPAQPSTPVVTIAVPPGEVAHLEGLEFYSWAPRGNAGCQITASGRVTFEDCMLFSSNRAALTTSGAHVTVVRGQVVQGSLYAVATPAIVAASSEVVLRDTSVLGADSNCLQNCLVGASPPTEAIRLTSSTLHAERTSFSGGSHVMTTFFANGAPGIVLTNDGSAWLSDCRVNGGSSNRGAGAPALVNNGSIPVRMRQTTLIPGSPGGVGSIGPIDPTAPLVRLALSAAWTRGMPSTLTVQGDANAPYGVWLAMDVIGSRVPPVDEPVWFLSGLLVAVGVLDARGNAPIVLTVPVDPGLEHAAAWFQAVSGLQLPLHASTIAGGVIR